MGINDMDDDWLHILRKTKFPFDNGCRKGKETFIILLGLVWQVEQFESFLWSHTNQYRTSWTILYLKWSYTLYISKPICVDGLVNLVINAAHHAQASFCFY